LDKIRIEEACRKIAPHLNRIETEFEGENSRFLELFSADHNEIGRVLRAHLIVERFMDNYLTHHYGIVEISSIRLSYVQKALLLPAKSPAEFIRPGVMRLNSIRNKFGHSIPYAINDADMREIYQILEIVEKNKRYPGPVDAIEDFARVVCAFLAVLPSDLTQIVRDAFAHVFPQETPSDLS
jgi:hypothetical protein